MATDSSLDTPHVAVINNGTYSENIGTTTFRVFCNDNNGFSVYAIGYSNNEFGNTKMLVTINGSASPANDIVTGTAISGTTSNWAMKLTKVAGTYEPTILSDANGSFSDYHVVPDEYTKVATLPSNTDFTNGSAFQTTYRAYVSPKQLAGRYIGKVRYALVHPASEVPNVPKETTAGKIGYYPNAGAVLDTMGDQDASANSEVVLWASNFKREGYGFAGWNTEYDYSGTTYGPNETITTPADLDTKGLSLYAVWVKSAGNLQGWTGCSALNIGDVTALTDTRDNDTYAVAKLADGKCWMIENLRLDDTATITPENTNNPVPGFALSASVNPTQTAWCTDTSSDCFNQSMLYTGNTTDSEANMANVVSNVYGYGNYYNWYSATAGNGTYSFNTNNTSVSGDICPKGWRLPRGGQDTATLDQNNDFYILTSTLAGEGPNYVSGSNIYYNGASGTKASKVLRTYPNNFLYSGYVDSSLAIYRGQLALFWSSTVFRVDYAYLLYFGSSNVNPGTTSGGKYFGSTVRCVTDL